MSPNGTSSGFDRILVLSSSESSDSESLLQEDITGNGNDFNKQWEAIERTLYQEPGQQVTDSELLKECKLWRETFPHFRVKGTKMDIKPNELEGTDQSMQTLQQHFNLKKLEEKRESIKKKVVGMLVDRLITKHAPRKDSANSVGNFKSGVQITEISDNCVDDFLGAPVTANKNKEMGFTTDKESYFERGKTKKDMPHPRPETMLQAYTQNIGITDSWEREIKTAKELSKPFQILENPSEKPKSIERFKLKKTPPSSTLGNTVKPFELTKKIDKKYDGLVDKIFERKCNELQTIRHCRTSASGLEMKSFQESLEKLRIESGFDDCMKRNTMPRINKFDNNWLKRGEMNFLEGFTPKKTQNIKSSQSLMKSNLYNEHEDMDEKLLEDLKRELNYKRPPKRSGVIEEIHLRRPKPFPPAPDNTSKILNGVHLKKKTKETNGQKLKNGTDVKLTRSDQNVKKPIKHINNKGSKANGNQNQRLPPIETGIVCIELTGRPKIGSRIPPKKH